MGRRVSPAAAAKLKLLGQGVVLVADRRSMPSNACTDALYPEADGTGLIEVMTPQEERDAAMAAYNAARIEFEAAQEQWDTYLAGTATINGNRTEAGVAFERLKNANEARQDAVDSLWLAWRNRPDADEPS